MPLIAVALDGDAFLHPFDDQVNAIAMICRVTKDAFLYWLRNNQGADQLKNIALEFEIKTEILLSSRLPTWV